MRQTRAGLGLLVRQHRHFGHLALLEKEDATHRGLGAKAASKLEYEMEHKSNYTAPKADVKWCSPLWKRRTNEIA